MYITKEGAMEYIETAVIDTIRDGLIHQYDKDQQMQQLIEEIGAEAGLSEQELAIVYQAYLEIKERMQYTANLVELWNQIEAVQHRMSLLHSYDKLENDLFSNDDIYKSCNTLKTENYSDKASDHRTKKQKKSGKLSKNQKKIDKLLKKQKKRIEKEWAKISGKAGATIDRGCGKCKRCKGSKCGKYPK